MELCFAGAERWAIKHVGVHAVHPRMYILMRAQRPTVDGAGWPQVQVSNLCKRLTMYHSCRSRTQLARIHGCVDVRAVDWADRGSTCKLCIRWAMCACMCSDIISGPPPKPAVVVWRQPGALAPGPWPLTQQPRHRCQCHHRRLRA